MLTDAELQAIRERCAKATPGAWEWNDTGGLWGDRVNSGYHVLTCESIAYVMEIYDANKDVCYCNPTDTKGPNEAGVLAEVGDSKPDADDAAFIAHARTDIPALLAEIDRLREELKRAAP